MENTACSVCSMPGGSRNLYKFYKNGGAPNHKPLEELVGLKDIIKFIITSDIIFRTTFVIESNTTPRDIMNRDIRDIINISSDSDAASDWENGIKCNDTYEITNKITGIVKKHTIHTNIICKPNILDKNKTDIYVYNKDINNTIHEQYVATDFDKDQMTEMYYELLVRYQTRIFNTDDDILKCLVWVEPVNDRNNAQGRLLYTLLSNAFKLNALNKITIPSRVKGEGWCKDNLPILGRLLVYNKWSKCAIFKQIEKPIISSLTDVPFHVISPYLLDISSVVNMSQTLWKSSIEEYFATLSLLQMLKLIRTKGDDMIALHIFENNHSLPDITFVQQFPIKNVSNRLISLYKRNNVDLYDVGLMHIWDKFPLQINIYITCYNYIRISVSVYTNIELADESFNPHNNLTFCSATAYTDEEIDLIYHNAIVKFKMMENIHICSHHIKSNQWNDPEQENYRKFLNDHLKQLSKTEAINSSNIIDLFEFYTYLITNGIPDPMRSLENEENKIYTNFKTQFNLIDINHTDYTGGIHLDSIGVRFFVDGKKQEIEQDRNEKIAERKEFLANLEKPLEKQTIS